jgi:hypothetical protein
MCDALENRASQHENDNNDHNKDNLIWVANNASLKIYGLCGRVGGLTNMVAMAGAAANAKC